MHAYVRQKTPFLGVVIAAVLLTGCATLVGGGSSQHVRVEAAPEGASFTIKASSGIQLASGAAPQTVRLPRKNEYQVEFTVPGYQPQTLALSRGTNGWIWGNLLFGWVVGFVVDFATGSAYKLEPALLQVTMVRGEDAGGDLLTIGVAKLFDSRGRLIAEKRAPLVPVR